MNGLSFIRRRCNLSQGQLAEKLGVTRQAINLWEKRREPLPEARKEQLSRFFGLEPELFDEINQEQKDALLHRPCFMYRNDDGHDYFLFGENPLRPVGCLLSEKTGQSFTQDEQMILDHRELEEMLDILREAVFPKDRSRWTAWDSNVAMNRMRCILGGMTDALEAVQKHPKDRKMDCFYLMMQVELALGGIEKDDLPRQAADGQPSLDTQSIIRLADEFQSWLRNRAEEVDSFLAK
ncbi:helix-turn-helix transcriptional regulator [Dysosmobacter welbionis]